MTRSTNYDNIGIGYANKRRADPRIASQIEKALSDMRTIVNVGAGAGSYEPSCAELIAVEPSARMIAQRSPSAAPAIQAKAESLPFPDAHFEASMSALSLHHWEDLPAGLKEMRRVSRKRIVLFTFLADAGEPFWLTQDYFPEFAREDRRIFPTLETLSFHLGAPLVSETVLIPHDLQDGFQGAYWRRPEQYLDPAVRASISSFARRPPTELHQGLTRLQNDLDDGSWAKKHGSCLSRETIDLGYRIVVAKLEGQNGAPTQPGH